MHVLSINYTLKRYCMFTLRITVSEITYMYVVKIQASEDLEDRESLAQMAASQNDVDTADGETYIEKYIRGVSAVESILTLDRLRQVKCTRKLGPMSTKRNQKRFFP